MITELTMNQISTLFISFKSLKLLMVTSVELFKNGLSQR